MFKILSLITKLTIIGLIITLNFSCGFHVIYKEQSSNQTELSYVNELASIRIKKNRDRLSQQLKNSLYDIFNPDHLESKPKYLLFLDINKNESPTFITDAGSSGRNKTTLIIKYDLKNLANGLSISQGQTKVNDNYDVTTNRYATYVAKNAINDNLAKLAAQNIRNSLVNDFIEIKKQCQEAKIKKSKDESDYDDDEFTCPLE